MVTYKIADNICRQWFSQRFSQLQEMYLLGVKTVYNAKTKTLVKSHIFVVPIYITTTKTRNTIINIRFYSNKEPKTDNKIWTGEGEAMFSFGGSCYNHNY